MVWMRTRRRAGFSDTRPSSQEPYSGVVASRPLCRVTASSTRPNRCARLGLAIHRGVSLIVSLIGRGADTLRLFACVS